MSALLAAQGQSAGAASAPISRSDALKDLFSQLDANSDGQVSKSEFENALGTGGSNIEQADDVFGKLDKNSDGSVSLDGMSSALKGAGGRYRHHHAGAPASAALSYSLVDQVAQRGANVISVSTASSLSVTA
jgi:Ca2+-binding EF-hand superfamily protein